MHIPSVLYFRRRIIFFTAATFVFCTMTASLLLPKVYKATSTLVVEQNVVDPISGQVVPVRLLPEYITTQVDVISSKRVAIQVVQRLKLSEKAEMREKFLDATDGAGSIDDWIAEHLLKRLKIDMSRESSVLNITFKDDNSQLAAEIANAFAAEYQKVVMELRNDPPKSISVYLDEQVGALRDALEKSQAKLSSYQQSKGIVGTDIRLDVETTRFNELSSDLVATQTRLMEAKSRGKQAAGGGAADSPDVAASPLIQNLRSSLAQAEARLAQVAEKFTPDHPQYQSAKAEVDKLRSVLNANVHSTSNSVEMNARVLQARENQIREALDAQRNKLLNLNQVRDEIAVMTRDIENAQRAYDTTIQRLNQAKLEGKVERSDVALLSAAVPPIKPYFPRLKLNGILSVLVGVIVGAGIAFIAELADRRVRTAAEIEHLSGVPVLAVMKRD